MKRFTKTLIGGLLMSITTIPVLAASHAKLDMIEDDWDMTTNVSCVGQIRIVELVRDSLVSESVCYIEAFDKDVLFIRFVDDAIDSFIIKLGGQRKIQKFTNYDDFLQKVNQLVSESYDLKNLKVLKKQHKSYDFVDCVKSYLDLRL